MSDWVFMKSKPGTGNIHKRLWSVVWIAWLSLMQFGPLFELQALADEPSLQHDTSSGAGEDLSSFDAATRRKLEMLKRSRQRLGQLKQDADAYLSGDTSVKPKTSACKISRKTLKEKNIVAGSSGGRQTLEKEKTKDASPLAKTSPTQITKTSDNTEARIPAAKTPLATSSSKIAAKLTSSKRPAGKSIEAPVQAKTESEPPIATSAPELTKLAALAPKKDTNSKSNRTSNSGLSHPRALALRTPKDVHEAVANSNSANQTVPHKSASSYRRGQGQPRLTPPPPPDVLSVGPNGDLINQSSYGSIPQRVAADDLRPPMKLMPPTDVQYAGGGENNFEEGPVQPDYVMGRGDQIQIIDYSGRDLRNGTSTQTVTVQRDGTISVYPVGVVKAAGRTVHQLTAIVNELAKKYVIDPEFIVSLYRTRPTVVYVLGDVQNPGVYRIGAESNAVQQAPTVQLSTSATVSQANGSQQPVAEVTSGADTQGNGTEFAPTSTIIGALAKAGGLRQSANIRDIRVTRALTKEVIHVDLWRLLTEGDASQDVELGARDTVFVPIGLGNFDPTPLGRLAATQKRPVRVWGAVRAPGLYELSAQDDVLSVIAKAGGFTPHAKTDHVILSRANFDGTVSERSVSIPRALASADGIARTKIQPGDVVVVNDSLVLAARGPLLKGTATFLGAAMLLYFSNKITNVNSRSGANASNSNVRVLAF